MPFITQTAQTMPGAKGMAPHLLHSKAKKVSTCVRLPQLNIVYVEHKCYHTIPLQSTENRKINTTWMRRKKAKLGFTVQNFMQSTEEAPSGEGKSHSNPIKGV